MMAVFGVEEWCERGEVFSVYFGMFGRLGIFGIRDGRLGRRRPFSAATKLGDDPWLGRRRDRLDRHDQLRRRLGGRLQGRDRKPLQLVRRRRHQPDHRARASPTRSSCCSASPASASSTCSACAGCGPSPAHPRFAKLRVGFAHTLIPIALAYLVAHYFSLFVFQEQAQFTYLLSDPLGTGTTDLFGTAGSGIDFNVLSANAIWYVQVGALVVGHVIGLMLAHDRALVYWPNYRRATASQYWMLAVMVAFTCFGLYLLSVSQRVAERSAPPSPRRPLRLWVLYALPVLFVVSSDRPRSANDPREWRFSRGWRRF